MWIADQWKDYEVLDTCSGEKLERWGDYLLVRPDPKVIWNTPRKNPGWKKKNGKLLSWCFREPTPGILQRKFAIVLVVRWDR